MVSGCFKRSKAPKLALIERVANRLKRKGKSRVIYREIFTSSGMEYDDVNTVHLSTRSDMSSPTGVTNRYRQKYLERFYLFRSEWLAVFIHRFWANDLDDIHDHPWDNVSWVIKGGYFEKLPDGTRPFRPPGFKAYRRAEQFHAVELEPGTEGKVWTLFIRFKRRRLWGYWHPDGWTAAIPQQGSNEV